MNPSPANGVNVAGRVVVHLIPAFNPGILSNLYFRHDLA